MAFTIEAIYEDGVLKPALSSGHEAWARHSVMIYRFLRRQRRIMRKTTTVKTGGVLQTFFIVFAPRFATIHSNSFYGNAAR